MTIPYHPYSMASLLQYIKEYMKRLSICLKTALPDAIAHRYRYRSAALSFYTVISIIPLIIVSTTILSILPFPTKDVASTLYQILPKIPISFESFLNTVFSILSQQRKLYAIGSFFTAYYFASSLFLALHHTLYGVFSEKDITTKTEIIIQVVSIPMFILALFFIYFGEVVITGITQWVITNPTMNRIIPEFFLSTLFFNIASVLSFFTFSLIIFLMYHFIAPRKYRQLRNSIIITGITGFVFTCLKYAFGLFVSQAAKVNPFYGAFGGVFAFLAWIFTAFIVILIGARTLYLLENTSLGLKFSNNEIDQDSEDTKATSITEKPPHIVRSQEIDRFKDEEFL